MAPLRKGSSTRLPGFLLKLAYMHIFFFFQHHTHEWMRKGIREEKSNGKGDVSALLIALKNSELSLASVHSSKNLSELSYQLINAHFIFKSTHANNFLLQGRTSLTIDSDALRSYPPRLLPSDDLDMARSFS